MASPLPPCHLICEGCSTQLVYPEGSSSVRCVLCSWVTDLTRPWVHMPHIQCERCRVSLMYPPSAHAVRCPYCNWITRLTPPNQEDGTEVNTVIVENPKTMDENGQLVSSMAVGISRRVP